MFSCVHQCWPKELQIFLSPKICSWGFTLCSGTCLSGSGGRASLQQQGVTHVAHSHRPGVGGQGELVSGAAVAVDVSTVSAVVLQTRRLVEISLETAYWQKKVKEKPTFLREMENSFRHCLHWVASSSFSQAWPCSSTDKVGLPFHKNTEHYQLKHNVFYLQSFVDFFKVLHLEFRPLEDGKFFKNLWTTTHQLAIKKTFGYTDWLRWSPISCRVCSCSSHFCCSCFFSCFNSCSSCTRKKAQRPIHLK